MQAETRQESKDKKGFSKLFHNVKCSARGTQKHYVAILMIKSSKIKICPNLAI